MSLAKACQRFAKQYESGYTAAFPGRHQSDLETCGYARGTVDSVGLIAVNLTYRSEAQRGRRRHAASALQALVNFGNPTAEIHRCLNDSPEMACFAVDGATGLVIVNDYDFPDDEVRPLGPGEVITLLASADSAGIYDGDTMARALTPQGVNNLRSDLLALLALSKS